MQNIKIFTVLLLISVLVGCGQKTIVPVDVDNSKDTVNVEDQQDFVKEDKQPIEDNTQPDSEQSNEQIVVPTSTPTLIPTPISTPVPSATPKPIFTPTPIAGKGEVVDFDVLNRLDNTKYGWSFGRNNKHEVPEIPAYARRLINDNEGMYVGNTKEKVVYLTFDEGYENGYTPKILDTLYENDVKALFFVTRSYIRKNQALVQRMLDDGHQVGNHTVRHLKLPDIDNVALEKEILNLHKEFKSTFGIELEYFRPPGGYYSERTLEATKQLGYKTVFWSFAYRDWETDNQKGADYAYKKVMDNLHNGAIILLHAVSKDNAQALDRIIKDVRAKGYEIRPFDL